MGDKLVKLQISVVHTELVSEDVRKITRHEAMLHSILDEILTYLCEISLASSQGFKYCMLRLRLLECRLKVTCYQLL